MSAPIRIAVLMGSTRKGSNGLGISHWVFSGLSQAAQADKLDVEIVPVDLSSSTYSLGPLLEDVVPQAIRDPEQYGNPAVANWSRFVSSCKGFVIVSPQYNWGYPGELKNALDHLFNEFAGKPVSIVTYGGHGGNKAGAQLREVMTGMHMKLVDKKVEINLPREYIMTKARVSPSASIALHGTAEDKDAWLQPFQQPLEESMGALLTAITTPPVSEEASRH